MTEQIYNIDAYKKEIKSTIVEIIEDSFVVDKTIFFPGGGGQPKAAWILNFLHYQPSLQKKLRQK